MIIEYNTEIDRATMAKFVSRCMGNTIGDFKPYKPNEHDDTFWTVDIGNDWKVKFFPSKPNEMEIMHRYHDDEAVIALATWICYRSRGKIQNTEE